MGSHGLHHSCFHVGTDLRGSLSAVLHQNSEDEFLRVSFSVVDPLGGAQAFIVGAPVEKAGVDVQRVQQVGGGPNHSDHDNRRQRRRGDRRGWLEKQPSALTSTLFINDEAVEAWTLSEASMFSACEGKGLSPSCPCG